MSNPIQTTSARSYAAGKRTCYKEGKTYFEKLKVNAKFHSNDTWELYLTNSDGDTPDDDEVKDVKIEWNINSSDSTFYTCGGAAENLSSNESKKINLPQTADTEITLRTWSGNDTCSSCSSDTEMEKCKDAVFNKMWDGFTKTTYNKNTEKGIPVTITLEKGSATAEKVKAISVSVGYGAPDEIGWEESIGCKVDVEVYFSDETTDKREDLDCGECIRNPSDPNSGTTATYECPFTYCVDEDGNSVDVSRKGEEGIICDSNSGSYDVAKPTPEKNYYESCTMVFYGVSSAGNRYSYYGDCQEPGNGGNPIPYIDQEMAKNAKDRVFACLDKGPLDPESCCSATEDGKYNKGCEVGYSPNHYNRCRIEGKISHLFKGYYVIPAGTDCDEAIKLIGATAKD